MFYEASVPAIGLKGNKRILTRTTNSTSKIYHNYVHTLLLELTGRSVEGIWSVAVHIRVLEGHHWGPEMKQKYRQLIHSSKLQKFNTFIDQDII